jgi:patatin-like phospholipase/acyl hydrolase
MIMIRSIRSSILDQKFKTGIWVKTWIMMQARSMPLKNAMLADVCISTSAAPTYLPAYYFQTADDNGKAREYNLIDGGVAANNPVRS